MSTHGPIINEEGLRLLGRNVSRITQGILLAVGIVSTVFTLAGEYSHGERYLQSWLVDNMPIMGAVLHLVLVLLILFPGRLHKANDDVRDPTLRAVIQGLNRFFIPAWTWIWVCFGLLYSVYLFRTMHPELGHALRMDHTSYQVLVREEAMMDLFNVGSTLFIAVIYYFLTPSFLRGYVRHKRGTPRASWRSGLPAKLFGFLGGEEPTKVPPGDPVRPRSWSFQYYNRTLLWLFSGRKAPRRMVVWYPDRRNAWVAWNTFLIMCFVAAVAAIALLYFRMGRLSFEDPASVEKWIALCLGLGSALALAAFAGRIDSQFIRNWQWVVPLLFLYAAIQTYTNVLYQDVAVERAVFTYAAFTLKCLLFIFVSNFFESRKAVYYAYEIVEGADDREL